MEHRPGDRSGAADKFEPGYNYPPADPIIGEVTLRLYLPPDKYYVWPPNMHAIFEPLPGIMPGVGGTAHYRVNSEGFRGDELSPDDDYRLITVGGSTTENMYMDQESESWPYLLQQRLNVAEGYQVWVGNVGRKGHTSREHTMQVQYLLEQHPELDGIIMLVGINDLSLILEQADAFEPSQLADANERNKILNRAFVSLPEQNPNLPYYRQSATWRVVENILQSREQLAGSTKPKSKIAMGVISN